MFTSPKLIEPLHIERAIFPKYPRWTSVNHRRMLVDCARAHDAGTREMKIRFAVSPGAARFDPDDLTLFAETAETLGFDTIWLSDVPLGPIGDPMVSLTYIAARTSRLK